MSNEADTKPTLESVIHRIDRLGTLVNQRFDEMEQNFSIRLDRIESLGNQTRAEMLALRADFTEMRKALREQLQNIP